MTFTDYLKTLNHYNEKTLHEKALQIQSFRKLCGKVPLEKTNRTELLKIIELHKERYTAQTVNNHLATLEQYFYFLMESGQRKDHPLKNFRILSDKKPLLKGFLTEEELDELYKNYPDKGHFKGQFDVYAKRNKVVLGLMIYQALGSGTLEKMQLTDLNLNKGFINVPAASNYKLRPRILPLEGVQIMALNSYVTETRPKLLALVKAKNENQDIFPQSENTRFSSITKSIFKKLSAAKSRENAGSEITSIHQLRISRIALWLKRYNLREVQYKAGYKSLQSLEPFNRDELEKLKEAVEKYHPF